MSECVCVCVCVCVFVRVCACSCAWRGVVCVLRLYLRVQHCSFASLNGALALACLQAVFSISRELAEAAAEAAAEVKKEEELEELFRW